MGAITIHNNDSPTPVCVDHDLTIDVAAAVTALTSASLPGQPGVGLSLLGTNDPGRSARSKESNNGLHRKLGRHLRRLSADLCLFAMKSRCILFISSSQQKIIAHHSCTTSPVCNEICRQVDPSTFSSTVMEFRVHRTTDRWT